MPNPLKEYSTKIYEGILGDVIGDVLHAGELDLTAKVAEVAKIDSRSTVLDLASGKGVSAGFLAENFGCNIVGLDLSTSLIKSFKRGSTKSPFLEKTEFTIGDAEAIPYIDSCFDVVMCECAFNLFPDKGKVLREIYRVLRGGGRFVLTDIVLKKDLPAKLNTQLTFALCVAGAVTLQGLRDLLISTGFVSIHVEDHSEKLIALGLKLLFSDLPADTPHLSVKDQEVLEKLFSEDLLGYALIVSYKPSTWREG
ncbi:MAG: methyltransferase domain-containing protein [Nitrososphaerota archaeon]|nr:methyltransferase domain-containing protein [Candidatus Bathyarchaeota archaeon]MDW8022202.1 methyltransferase domain-containing protein [Nitrososphaerota archaeon]